MDDNVNITYRYRRWPLYLPLYSLFVIVYFFAVYSLAELSYRSLAESFVMTAFILAPLASGYFDVFVAKASAWGQVAKHIFFSWLYSLIIIFALMLTYLEGEEWFGAIALLFFFLLYSIAALPISYLVFRIRKKKQARNNDA